MKRFIISAVSVLILAFASEATVLFPHFVDIAPNYEEGNTPELTAAGVDCAMYHSTKPGFMASDFTEVEAFFKDTLPGDVSRSETKVGDCVLVTYSSAHDKNDAMETGTIMYTIYVLRRPDNSFVAAYCEKKVK